MPGLLLGAMGNIGRDNSIRMYHVRRGSSGTEALTGVQ
jgi:hypothetical protein